MIVRAHSPLPLLGLCLMAMTACVPKGPEPKAEVPELPPTFDGTVGQRTPRSVPWNSFLQDSQLRELVRQALRDNLELKIAAERVEVARASVRLAKGAQLPRVDFAAGAGVRKFGLYTMDGAGNATTDITPGQTVPEHLPDLAFGLQAKWEVDLWGKLKNQRGAALARYLASQEGVNLLITSVVADVAINYFDLIAGKQGLDVLTRTLTHQEEALDVMRLQKKVGRVNELAVQQFASQLEDTRAVRTRLTQAVRETEIRLNLLLGRLPREIASAAASPDKELATSIELGIPSDLLENRPDIREARLLLEAAKCDVKAARAAFFPSVNITGGLGYQAFDPRFLLSTPESIAYSVSGGLVAPVVNRSAVRSEFDAASAGQLEAMYHYQKVVLTGFAEVAIGISKVQRASEIVHQRKAKREALDNTVDTATLLFSTGNAGYFEVLAAEQSALRVELELIEAYRDERNARVFLYRALGGGW